VQHKYLSEEIKRDCIQCSLDIPFNLPLAIKKTMKHSFTYKFKYFNDFWVTIYLNVSLLHVTCIYYSNIYRLGSITLN